MKNMVVGVKNSADGLYSRVTALEESKMRCAQPLENERWKEKK